MNDSRTRVDGPLTFYIIDVSTKLEFPEYTVPSSSKETVLYTSNGHMTHVTSIDSTKIDEAARSSLID